MGTKELASVAGALALAACGLDGETTESAQPSMVAHCPIIHCGDNAPSGGDGLIFDELNLYGWPNHAGVRLADATFTQTGHDAFVYIWQDILYAYDWDTATWYSGPYLVNNLEIHLRHDGNNVDFDLLVTGYDGDHVQFRAGVGEIVPVYEFTVRTRGPSAEKFYACNRTPVVTDPLWSSSHTHYALVYGGDKYDPSSKTVMSDDPLDGWAFIACNGSAGTKMHLHRHTLAGAYNDANDEQYMTSLPERTALLKAITADYCGTGAHQFTKWGQPLAFKTAHDPSIFSPPYTSVASVEAVWSSTGAVCLDKPRREMFGITKDYVETKCTPRTFPSCATMMPWTAFGHVITGNPPPPP